MFRKSKGEFETIAVRHTEIIDNDKVRYRVYRSATEYIAVIAENALMAMKLSGVNEPYKVVRDLFNEGGAVEASRMRDSDDTPRITISITAQKESDKKNKIEDLKYVDLDQPFTPMSLSELKQPRLHDEQVMGSATLMKHIEIDPIAYALATRSDEAQRINETHATEAIRAQAEPEVILEPSPEMSVDMVEASPEPAPEVIPEPISPKEIISEEALPVDEIARLLAEPRS